MSRRSRLEREEKTISAMTGIFCAGHHGTRGQELCIGCAEFLDYARKRLERCPFQEKKATCAQCAVHCYRPDMREKVKTIMRYAGPRMTWRRPLLALLHALDGRIKRKK